MQILETVIKDLYIIEPRIWKDNRGYFFESFKKKLLEENGLMYDWTQENEAFSNYGVIRGLHYQNGSSAQAKLVRVIQGEVLDVVVDLRRKSPTFKQAYTIILNDKNKKQLLVPRGFAHGYAVLSETALFAYKCDNVYQPEQENGIHPHDPLLQIDWMIPNNSQIISEKDKALPYLKNQPENALF